MIHADKIILAVFLALAMTVGVYADMTPTPSLDGDRPPAAQQSDRTACPSPNSHDLLIDPVLADLHRPSGTFPPTTSADVHLTGETQRPVQILTSDQGSLDLCLYALMGLGFCKSAPWVRKLSFGHVPEWYHDGGPYQIGHSFAVSPESLCPVPVHCFVQPDHRAEEFITRRRLRAIVSSWRTSQFTPCTLASRGPPETC